MKRLILSVILGLSIFCSVQKSFGSERAEALASAWVNALAFKDINIKPVVSFVRDISPVVGVISLLGAAKCAHGIYKSYMTFKNVGENNWTPKVIENTRKRALNSGFWSFMSFASCLGLSKICYDLTR